MSKDKFLIRGLAGAKKLKGEIIINGAKNAALKAIPACILFEDDVTLDSVPYTEDVKKLCHLLTLAGATIENGIPGKIKISSKGLKNTDLDVETAKSMRASLVVTGPILARYGRVTFPAPGGCVIGARPTDLLFMGLEKLGAKITVENGQYVFTSAGPLVGAEIFFPVQTVTGTETLMMAAVLARGKTIMKNCAMEPEIKHLAGFLNSCGAKIEGAGTPTIEITGGPLLHSDGKIYHIVPDRVEAGSYLILGALCADDLKISNCIPEHLESTVNLLQSSGVPIIVGKDFLHIKGNAKIPYGKFKNFNVKTHEYPGFPTDLQAQMATFLTQTEGQSIVFETIYEGRLKYVEELIKLGADITTMSGREILIKGPTPFHAVEELFAHDIRAGFATVIAALLSDGDSILQGVHYIDRGYEKLEERLRSIGADIQRVI
ncbi:MAG: UDP-N-acetylglucosamine 1-carboxyvinyltransferase [Candidatus Taylorbacteria bacterium]|nr:UDP-N-acetylglucosamine 1-carboxyvinyltransferase [Candidatus Taylorbacteria bacterium]